MTSPIEARLSAYVERGLAERIPAAVEAHMEAEGAAPVDWARIDEFGQALLLRIVEDGNVDVITAILKHVDASQLANITFV